MDKAILIIDMPEFCCNCPLNFWNKCIILEEKAKTSGHIENPSRNRLKDCPLKLLPEKYDIEKEMLKPHDRDCTWEFEGGYNACIDEILDKEVT